MRKCDIARAIARKTGVSRAEAADQLDRVVTEILENLRSGGSAKMPGLGSFLVDSTGRIAFREEPDSREQRLEKS